jgi:hypothetical protein
MSFNITAYMRFMYAILLTLLLAISSPSWANDIADLGSGLGLKNISQDHSEDRILEFWAYHNYQGSENYSDTLKLRYYEPLSIDRWRGTMRLDTSYIAPYGPTLPSQATGQYSAGNTLLTVWGGLPDWQANFGGRIIFPFGNNGQWVAGPQVSTSFSPAEGSHSVLSDFSPLMRYMYGFDSKNNTVTSGSNQGGLLRTLSAFPTIGLRLAHNTQLRLWDENGIAYNTAGGGWFVPIDAMVTHRLNKNLLLAIGASKQVVQSYPEYKWSVYGKVSFNF